MRARSVLMLSQRKLHGRVSGSNSSELQQVFLRSVQDEQVH